MFQVVFPMKSGTGMKEIKGVIPAGWDLKPSNNDNHIWIVDWGDENSVGYITRLPDKIIISVGTRTTGKFFWRGFALKYPELDPYDMHFGVVYAVNGEINKWELDEFPKHNPIEVQNDISHYLEVSQAYYVSFFLGDWHWKNEIQVQSCRKINVDGTLGKNHGTLMFPLRSFETKES